MKKAVQVKIALSFHMILAAMGLLIWPGLTTAETAIIAHRGGRGLMPDNTLDAFAEALGVGVTALHVNVGASRDGIFVAYHNLYLDRSRTRDHQGRWLSARDKMALKTLTFRELRRFDVGKIRLGSPEGRRFPDQAQLDDVRIPAFVEILQLVRRARNASVAIIAEVVMTPYERADALPPRVLAQGISRAFARAGFDSERSFLQSLDWITLRLGQQQKYKLSTVMMTAEQSWLNTLQRGRPGPSPWLAGFDVDDFDSVPDLVHAAGGDVWAPFRDDLSEADLARARELGLDVWIWVVNQAEDMDYWMNQDVDGIATDFPVKLRRLLSKRGQRLPRKTPVKP